MAELKTKKNEGSVSEFLEGIADPTRREESKIILEVLRTATGEEPVLWGDSIVGFGDYHYRYASGREGDWFRVGFSPRKQALTLYLTGGYQQDTDLLQRLGRYKTGSGCLYLPKLRDVDLNVLGELVKRANERQTG